MSRCRADKEITEAEVLFSVKEQQCLKQRIPAVKQAAADNKSAQYFTVP